MTRAIEEQLSALLDGELPEAEEELLLRRLQRDPDHAATLARYGLIGEVMRGSGGATTAAGLGERVRTALAGEASHAEVSTGPRRVSRGLLGAGLAAGLALVAVISVERTELVRPEPGPELAQVAAAVTPARPEPGRAGVTVTAGRPQTVVLAPARLTGYLVSHGEYASRLGRRVMDSHIINQTPDVLAASYSAGTADD